MDLNTAQDLLKELLFHLPTGWWWLLHQKEENDLGIAKAFDRPRAEIEALLVNARICQENGNGFTIVKKKFDSFCATLSAPMEVQTCARRIYIVNGVDEYRTPTNQIKSKVRYSKWGQLTGNMVESIRKSAEHYDRQNANAAKREKDATKRKKEEAEAAAN